MSTKSKIDVDIHSPERMSASAVLCWDSFGVSVLPEMRENLIA